MNAITLLSRLGERIWNVATWTSVSVATLFLAIISNARASIHGGFRIVTTSCPHLVPWATSLTADIPFGPFCPVTIYFKLRAIRLFALIHLDDIIYIERFWYKKLPMRRVISPMLIKVMFCWGSSGMSFSPWLISESNASVSFTLRRITISSSMLIFVK